MKSLHYSGIAFSVFGAIILLSNIGAAYEAFRGGVIAVFLILVCLSIVAAIGCIIFAASKSEDQGLGLEGIFRAAAPALIILLTLIIGGGAGAWSTWSGASESRDIPAQTPQSDDDSL